MVPEAALWARGKRRTMTVLLSLGLSGCASNGPCQPAHLEVPAAWTMSAPESAMAAPADQGWWQQLNDPAIDSLADAALINSPTVEQAIARLDEARAVVGVTSAQRLPSAGIDGSSARARTLNTDSPAAGTTLGTQTRIGPGFSAEIDLSGRIRNSVEACRLRVEARDAGVEPGARRSEGI